MSDTICSMNTGNLFISAKGDAYFSFNPPSEMTVSFSVMPSIKKVIYNGTHTVVCWSDDTKTVVNCIDEDSFNKEVGLAMAISRKYFEQMGSKTPRARFMKHVNEASSY